MLTHLHIVYGYFHTKTAELSSCHRESGPKSMKYLLSGPLRKSLPILARESKRSGLFIILLILMLLVSEIM